MKLTPRSINLFLFMKLPSAWWSGVRVIRMSDEQCLVSVKHRWVNQNPFGSMYFAVQAMAAELSTGALVMSEIQKSERKISMLVAQNSSEFTKKAKGRVTFSCMEGSLVQKKIKEAIATGEGQKFWLTSAGINQEGVEVATFRFEWTIKVK